MEQSYCGGIVAEKNTLTLTMRFNQSLQSYLGYVSHPNSFMFTKELKNRTWIDTGRPDKYLTNSGVKTNINLWASAVFSKVKKRKRKRGVVVKLSAAPLFLLHLRFKPKVNPGTKH